MFIEKDQMIGQQYISKTREYLDYLEEHLDNIRKAFQELSEACDGMIWVGDDCTWHTLRQEVCHHDISKFSAEEFVQYRDRFFPLHIPSAEDYASFDKAWEHHKANNTHHHESIRTDGRGNTEKDLVHMLVDWVAMGYKFGKTAKEYYEANKHNIKLLPEHEKFIYTIFERLDK